MTPTYPATLKILIIRFSSLGDIVLTFDAVEKLNKNLQSIVEIHYLTKNMWAELIKSQFPHVHVHCISNHASFAELIKKIFELKKINFDIVLDLHRNLRSRITTLILFKKYFVVKKNRFLELFLFFFRRKVYLKFFNAISKRKNNDIVVTHALKLVDKLNLNLPLSFKKNNDQNVLKLKSKQPTLGVSIESAWSTKQWNSESFQKVTNLIRNEGVQVVWFGLKELPFPVPSTDRCYIGTHSLSSVSNFLKNEIDVFLTNDSGLLHLAEYFGVPVVALFGPTTTEIGFSPKLNHSRVVEKDLWCRPCSKTGKLCFRLKNKQKCLSMITVDEVYNELRSLFNILTYSRGSHDSLDL